ncbi:MAG: PEGA domain-containing protein, partial [Candidatus Marinimicrobia bacterium]|nr:PEGA domain-containing protein [Candidatus Neomarinimicrobiota bacterium]
MKKQKVYIFPLLLSSCLLVAGSETLVVMDFANENVSASDARIVTDRVRTALVDYNLFDVVEREKFDEILKEQGQQLSDCFSDECAIELGKMAGAKYMVAGRVSKSGSGFYLSARIIDVGSTKMMAKKDMILRSSDVLEILETAPNLVNDLMQQFTTKKGLALGSGSVMMGQSKLGKVKLILSESNVQLIIDGESRGYIPRNEIPIQLSEGIHTITITKEGFRQWSETINVISNSITERTIKLEQIGESVQTKLDWSFLTIRTEPENATVIIDGIEYGQTYFDGKVNPGKHTLLLSRPLYYDLIKEIELTPGEMLNLTETLHPNFGSVEINTTPLEATVMIDDKIETNKTPLMIPRLQSGQHELRISYPEYRDYTATILVDDNKTSSLDIKLVPAFGYLNLTTTPAGAELIINDVPVAKTPVTGLKLMSGQHLITIKAEYYKDTQEMVTIEDGKTLEKTIAMSSNFGTLSVQAAPQGAKIYIDGKLRGSSPAVIEPVLVGSHDLKIDAGKHYRPEERKVFIGLGQTEVIQTALKEKVGDLMISTNPPGAKILIDGDYYKLKNGNIATTPVKLTKVWSGKRTITFDLPGYTNGKTEIDVLEDQVNVVRASLNKIVFIKPRKEALWRSAVLPGFGQLYEKRYETAAVYFLSESFLTITLFCLKDDHKSMEADYLSLRHDYENLNGTTEEIQSAWNDVQDAYN